MVHRVSHWPGSFSLQSSLQVTNTSPSQPRVGLKPSMSPCASIGLEDFAISVGHHRHHFDSKGQLSLLQRTCCYKELHFLETALQKYVSWCDQE